jgi:competence ComEA-like helix-hairpin-helix protein
MPLRLSTDESRAVAFIGLLLVVSAGARMLRRPVPFEPDAAAVDLSELERASRKKAEGPPRLGPGERLDPNTATADRLMGLPGASRAVVQRIVEERAKAPFRSADDLRRVAGIGPATVQKWRDLLVLPVQLSSPVPAQAVAAGTDRASVATGPVDLNHAGAAELERLPGVGPVLARRIVEWRDSAGGFRSVEQLEEVRGVGPAMMRRLTPLIRIGN